MPCRFRRRRPRDLVARELDRHLDHLAELIGASWLLGEQPWLCDFAVAAQLLYVSRTPLGAGAVAERPVLERYLERFRALRAR